MIKLFSPNIKYRNSVPASLQQATPLDKPYFPISMRLLRVVSILIQKYHSLLVSVGTWMIILKKFNILDKNSVSDVSDKMSYVLNKNSA